MRSIGIGSMAALILGAGVAFASRSEDYAREPEPRREPEPDRQPGPPPRSFALNKQNRATARRIGIEFDGFMRSDVVAYDADAGWIDTQDGRHMEGTVRPYWRHASAPARTVATRSAEDHLATEARAEEKRARKAAKALKIAKAAEDRVDAWRLD